MLLHNSWTPETPKGRLRWLTRPEARKLIKAAEKSTQAPYLADLIRVALVTGMRKGELLGLTWDRVDLRRRLFPTESLEKTTTYQRLAFAGVAGNPQKTAAGISQQSHKRSHG